MIETVRSNDERYQYQLSYRWNDGPVCGWILLNPSFTGRGDDRGLGVTGQRCVNYAIAWGYGGVVIRNRFAYRVTDPRELLTVDDPHGVENHTFIRRALLDPITVAAWGCAAAVRAAKPLPPQLQLKCIGVNIDGSPRHVLHAPSDSELMPWPRRMKEAV